VNVRLPAQVFLDKSIVTVPAHHALGRIQVIDALQFDLGNIFHNVHQLIDGHHFGGFKIDRLQNAGVHDLLHAVDSVVDVHKAAGARAIAPDNDFVLPAGLGLNHFPANCSGSLFASAVPCAVRSIHVVKARDADVHPAVFGEMPAHALAEQLLPAVAILSQRRVGVLFLQARIVGIRLFLAVIGACRPRVEEFLDAVFLRGLKHVRIDQHRQNAQGFVVLDKTHAAHIGCEVVHFR
jgi:hypothetical protein